MMKHVTQSNLAALIRSAAFSGLTFICVGATPVAAATLMRSVDVNSSPSAVWSAIGSWCAIKDWLPPVGMCIEDGKTPPTRTLVTKDGKAAFVETQTARSDAEHSYSYAFKSSPLPLTGYISTIKVSAKGDGNSTVTWTGTYTPDVGKEKDTNEALSGIYESGLASIKARFAK